MKSPNQAQCDHANSLREYERIHAQWMATSIFHPVEYQEAVKAELYAARTKYMAAVEAANPNITVT